MSPATSKAQPRRLLNRSTANRRERCALWLLALACHFMLALHAKSPPPPAKTTTTHNKNTHNQQYRKVKTCDTFPVYNKATKETEHKYIQIYTHSVSHTHKTLLLKVF